MRTTMLITERKITSQTITSQTITAQSLVLCRLKMKPFPKPAMTHQGRFGRKTQEYLEKKERLLLLYRASRGFDVYEPLHLVFCLPVPPSRLKGKNRVTTGEIHLQKPDTDNMLKSFLDSLLPKGDGGDEMIWDIRGTKVWWEPTEEYPEGLIEVRSLPKFVW